MAAPNFASVLDRPSTEVVRPPACPVGNYICAHQGLPRRDKSSKKQTEYVEFQLKPISVVEGTVDAEAVAELGGLGNFPNFRLTFYMTEKSGYRLKEYLQDDLKLEWNEDETTLWEVAQTTASQQVMVTLKHTPTEDGKGVFHEIASTAPVE